MLVKFLSFIASFLSNTRYKAVLIPCTIVVLSITSLTAVALVHDSGSQSATSAAGQTGETDTNTTQSPLSPQVGSDSQDTKDSSQPVAQEPATNKPADGGSGSSPATSASPATDKVEIILSSATANIESDGFSRTVIAAASDGKALTWAITPESTTTESLQIVTESQETAPNFSFRFRAPQDIQAGQYKFTLTAKDSARGVELSKVIVVTVGS